MSIINGSFVQEYINKKGHDILAKSGLGDIGTPKVPDKVLCKIRSSYLVVLVIEHFEATVRHEHLRNADAFRCLIVL